MAEPTPTKENIPAHVRAYHGFTHRQAFLTPESDLLTEHDHIHRVLKPDHCHTPAVSISETPTRRTT